MRGDIWLSDLAFTVRVRLRMKLSGRTVVPLRRECLVTTVPTATESHPTRRIERLSCTGLTPLLLAANDSQRSSQTQPYQRQGARFGNVADEDVGWLTAPTIRIEPRLPRQGYVHKAVGSEL